MKAYILYIIRMLLLFLIILLQKPTFAQNITYETVRIPDMGYISLPSNMEIQTGRVREVALQQLSASRVYSIEIIGDRVVFQQSGLGTGLGRETYARVIIRTHIGHRNQFPMLNSQQRWTNTELNDYDRSFQSALSRDSRIRITNWYGVENVMLNNRYNGVKISYSRQTLNNPPVFTIIYEINNNDRQHVLSFSFREAHSQYWEPVMQRVIESIVINPVRADHNINPRSVNDRAYRSTDFYRSFADRRNYSRSTLYQTQANVIPESSQSVSATKEEGGRRRTLDYGAYALIMQYSPENIRYVAERENAEPKLYPLEYYQNNEHFQHIDKDRLTAAYVELENEYRLFLAGEFDDKETTAQYIGLPEAAPMLVGMGMKTKPPSPGPMFLGSADIMHIPGVPDEIDLTQKEPSRSKKDYTWVYVIVFVIGLIVLLVIDVIHINRN